MKTGMKRPMVGPAVSKWMGAIGRLGGLSKSKKKMDALARNRQMPCAPGKRRGRPKKVKAPPVERIEFACAAPGCGELITLSGEPIAILRRGREIAVVCPKCGIKTRVPPSVVA